MPFEREDMGWVSRLGGIYHDGLGWYSSVRYRRALVADIPQSRAWAFQDGQV